MKHCENFHALKFDQMMNSENRVRTCIYIYKYSRKKSDIAKEVAETLGIWEVREIARAETWENAESQITVIIAAL